MRKNRKMSKKMSVMAGRTVQIGAVMVMVFAMVIVNMLASSSCKQLEKTIREKERQLKRLDDEKERESARWTAMVTPENLEATLLKFGLAMKTPRAEQWVRLKSDGTPWPGQISVAKAAERNRTTDTAKYVAPRPEALAAVRPAAQRPAARPASRSAVRSAAQRQASSRPAAQRPSQQRPAAPSRTSTRPPTSRSARR